MKISAEKNLPFQTGFTVHPHCCQGIQSRQASIKSRLSNSTGPV